jgi:choline kinase
MRNFFYILIFILIASCTSNTIFKKPDDLISKEEMVNLLTDLYLTSAAKNAKTIHEERNIDYTYLVFEKYGIDTTRFKKSNFYYTTKIDDYEDIYKQVQKRIKDANNKYKGIRKVKDSIRRDSIKVIRDSIKSIKKRLDSIKKDSLQKIKGISKDSIDVNTSENFEKIKDAVLTDSLPKGRETIF